MSQTVSPGIEPGYPFRMVTFQATAVPVEPTHHKRCGQDLNLYILMEYLISNQTLYHWATTALFVLFWYLFFLILFKTNFAPTVGFEPTHPLGLLPVFKAGSLPIRIKWANEVSVGFEPTNNRFAVCWLKPLALRYQKQELKESNPYHPGWSRRSYH